MNIKTTNKIDQRGASAGDKIIAGNNVESINVLPQPQKTKVENLLEKLQAEIEGDIQAKQLIDDLQFYHNRYSVDGIDGLENKLRHCGEDEEIILKAMMKKEAFNKKLEKFTHYNSAQEIFALLLSKVDALFEAEIYGLIGNTSSDEIKKLTKEKVVDPVMGELSDDIMGINYNHVSGMIYWLAEQCFVRWHK